LTLMLVLIIAMIVAMGAMVVSRGWWKLAEAA
jgi:hypothetical protein